MSEPMRCLLRSLRRGSVKNGEYSAIAHDAWDPNNRQDFDGYYKSRIVPMTAYATQLARGAVTIADEAVERAFEKSLLHLMEHQEICPTTCQHPDGWMKAIIRNYIIDALRHCKVHDAHAEELAQFAQAFQDSLRWEEKIDDRLVFEQADLLIQKLPYEEYLIAVETWYENRSSKDIAIDLGLSDGKVRKIRQRIIKKLRKELGIRIKGGSVE